LKIEDDIVQLLIVLIKCFLILALFTFLLPKLIDKFLFMIYKSNFYDNSIFVNYIVDKNSKLLYNYIYIIKLMLGTR
jgi:hypothetical protein